MIKCLIIDDEPKARILLKAIIDEYIPELTIEALCEDLPTGVKAIKRHKPDIIFLDIEMPGHSGLELLDFFEPEEVNFSIIFTTAYNEYALQAFKFSAVDYLLKPIDHVELIAAVQRFHQQREIRNIERLQALKSNLISSTDIHSKRLVINTSQSAFFIKPADVVMIKGDASYSEFYLLDGTKLLASYNLKHYEDLLSGLNTFFRCHKSYIVNIYCIEQMNRQDGTSLKLSGGLQALISANRVEELMEKLK